MLDYEIFSVKPHRREPLIRWMREALELSGCEILHVSESTRGPFRLTFETRMGERMGIVAYAFLANSRLTKNRPPDEHRFQIKYGKKDGLPHALWQDPFELYTTLFLGINLEHDFFVAADPVLHSPTLFYISLEFKERNARAILAEGWTSWERAKARKKRGARKGSEAEFEEVPSEPAEILAGGTKEHFRG